MLVYFAVIMIGLFGFSGLVVDVGRIELRSLQLQAAADAAALSAAAEYQRTANLTTAKNAAQAEINSNATLNNTTTITPTVTLGAASGYYKGDGSTIQVSVTQPISTTLLSLIKGSNSTINASATAVAMIPPCVYLMGNPSMPWRGNNNLDLSSQGFDLTCPMYSTTGYFVDGFSHINYWQAKASGPASQSYGGGWESPALIANSPVLSDPLAYVSSPVFSPCNPLTTGKIYSTSQTIIPGTYCGTFRVTNGATITMTPGLYIITGGINIDGASTLQGNGVTLYLTRGGGYPFGTVRVDSSTLNISAPLDNSGGGRAAILLMTDRAWTGGYEDIYFNYATLKGDGLFYITGTGIYSWQSHLSGYKYFSFVTANFAFQASAFTFSSDYSQLPGGNPFHTVVSLVQ